MADFTIRPLNLDWLGELPDIAAKAKERQRDEQLAQILQSRGPDGTMNYADLVNRAAAAGNVRGVETFSRLANAAAASGRAAQARVDLERHRRAMEGKPQIFGNAQTGFYTIDNSGQPVAVQGPTVQPEPEPDVFPPNPLQQEPASDVSRPQQAPQELPQPENIPGTATVQPPWLQGGQLAPAPAPLAPPAATPRAATAAPAVVPPRTAQAGPAQAGGPRIRQLVPPAPKESAEFTPEARDLAARRLINGDPGALSTLGRGAQGDRAIKAVQNRAAEMLMVEKNMTAEQAAAAIGEAKQKFSAAGIGKNAWARTAANREANLDIILKATEAAFPAAIEASNALPRTRWVPLNRIIQKGQAASSDPRLLKFGMANLQLAEHWARAMNPTGVMRESDRDKALHFLDTATSHDSYQKAVRQLEVQIQREAAAVRAGHVISSVPGSSRSIPRGAIEDLLGNPSSAALFDAEFGPGQAERILGSAGVR